jgi:ubiquinone/menaquinone biosynthesis C-methylase UbiE
MRFLLELLAKLAARLRFLSFEALYYPLAPFYDTISRAAFLGQWERWQQTTLPRIQGKRVLEVGCGTGSLLSEMLRRGYKAYGIDASLPMLKQAQRKLAKQNQSLRVFQAHAEALPFPDQSFETVISTFPTNYITKPTVLKEINRVLYPGGRLLIVDDAELHPFNRKAAFLIRLYNIFYFGSRRAKQRPVGINFGTLLSHADFVRRDETSEDQFGMAHIIIALKVW